jgi:hypothetical protein
MLALRNTNLPGKLLGFTATFLFPSLRSKSATFYTEYLPFNYCGMRGATMLYSRKATSNYP